MLLRFSIRAKIAERAHAERAVSLQREELGWEGEFQEKFMHQPSGQAMNGRVQGRTLFALVVAGGALPRLESKVKPDEPHPAKPMEMEKHQELFPVIGMLLEHGCRKS